MADPAPAVAGGAVLPPTAEVEMLRPAVGEEGARRMRDQQIPAVVQDGADVADDVRPGALARQQIAGHGVVAARPEGIPTTPENSQATSTRMGIFLR